MQWPKYKLLAPDGDRKLTKFFGTLQDAEAGQQRAAAKGHTVTIVELPGKGLKKPCHKVWHASLEDAEQCVKKMQKDSRIKKPELLNAYFCGECFGYHVGRNYLLKYPRLISLCVGESR